MMSDFFRRTGRSILGSFSLLRNDSRGVAAIEYGLIASLIAVVIVVVVTTIGTDLLNLYNRVGEGVRNAASTK
jgi:pilus assembly protein Flp/PilA